MKKSSNTIQQKAERKNGHIMEAKTHRLPGFRQAQPTSCLGFDKLNLRLVEGRTNKAVIQKQK